MDAAENDGGYASRKLALTVLGMGLITVLALFSGKVPTLSGVFDGAVMGIVGLATAYMGGNVASKFALSRGPKDKDDDAK